MWKDLFSIEEKRLSALIAGFFITLLFALVMYWKRGDITANLANVLQWLVFGVVGGGAVQAVKDYSEYRRIVKDGEDGTTQDQDLAGPL